MFASTVLVFQCACAFVYYLTAQPISKRATWHSRRHHFRMQINARFCVLFFNLFTFCQFNSIPNCKYIKRYSLIYLNRFYILIVPIYRIIYGVQFVSEIQWKRHQKCHLVQSQQKERKYNGSKAIRKACAGAAH